MKKKEYFKPEAKAIRVRATSLFMSSPFGEAETWRDGPKLGDPDDFEDEPGL